MSSTSLPAGTVRPFASAGQTPNATIATTRITSGMAMATGTRPPADNRRGRLAAVHDAHQRRVVPEGEQAVEDGKDHQRLP